MKNELTVSLPSPLVTPHTKTKGRARYSLCEIQTRGKGVAKCKTVTQQSPKCKTTHVNREKFTGSRGIKLQIIKTATSIVRRTEYYCSVSFPK